MILPWRIKILNQQEQKTNNSCTNPTEAQENLEYFMMHRIKHILENDIHNLTLKTSLLILFQ